MCVYGIDVIAYHCSLDFFITFVVSIDCRQKTKLKIWKVNLVK